MSRSKPWLGGVCAHLADRLEWNVTGLRVATVLAAWWMPLVTVPVYVLGALAVRHSGTRDPAMDDWDRRMGEIDRRYRKY